MSGGRSLYVNLINQSRENNLERLTGDWLVVGNSRNIQFVNKPPVVVHLNSVVFCFLQYYDGLCKLHSECQVLLRMYISVAAFGGRRLFTLSLAKLSCLCFPRFGFVSHSRVHIPFFSCLL